MRAISLSHLTNVQLVGTARHLVTQDHANLADLIWHLAEIDSRRLYLEKAHPSMLEFCIEELGMTEDVALKRIWVGRVARRHPRVIDYLADGRLNVSAVRMLRPYFGAAKPAELFEAAARKSRAQIEQMLAERFPKTETMQLIEAAPVAQNVAVANGGSVLSEPIFSSNIAPATYAVASQAPGPVSAPWSEVRPVAPQRFALHLMMRASLREKIEHAQRLFSHQVPSGDVAELMEKAFDLLIAKGEKSKFAATDRPQKKERPTESARHIPNRVKRAVRARDGAQCTFVSPEGRRCGCMTQLEYDHIVPVAHGGKSTVDNVRMRCRGHNQYEAQRAFGSGFMEQKRAQARGGRTATAPPPRQSPPALTPEQIARNAELARAAVAECEARAREQRRVDEVVPWLRALGVGVELARKAAETCRQMAEASLEERVKEALRYVACHACGAARIGLRRRRRAPPGRGANAFACSRTQLPRLPWIA